MFNRLRRWFHRPLGGGAPLIPLSVQVSEPWTIDRIESELRGGFSRRPGGHHCFGACCFDHDSVQLAADFRGPESTWPMEYTHQVLADPLFDSQWGDLL